MDDDPRGLSAVAYRSGWTPVLYDGLVQVMFSPLGGAGRMRDQALDMLGDVRGRSVLELGCGSGALTRRLVRRGAVVTSVDGSSAMLATAMTRAPEATFVRARLEALPALGVFDLV